MDFTKVESLLAQLVDEVFIIQKLNSEEMLMSLIELDVKILKEEMEKWRKYHSKTIIKKDA